MRHQSVLALASSVAGILAVTAGPLEAQVFTAHGIEADATFGSTPGTLGIDVYRQASGDSVCVDCENIEMITDLHLTQAGDLVSFDFAYSTLAVSPGTPSATATINFYSNDPSDSSLPLDPTTIDRVLTSPADFSGNERVVDFAEFADETVITDQIDCLDVALDSGVGGTKYLGGLTNCTLVNGFCDGPPFSAMVLTFETTIRRVGFEIQTLDTDDLDLTISCVQNGMVVGSQFFNTGLTPTFVGLESALAAGVDSASGFDEVRIEVTNDGLFILKDLRFEYVSSPSLLGSVCVTDLPVSGPFDQIVELITVDVGDPGFPAPISLPQDVWVGVKIDLVDNPGQNSGPDYDSMLPDSASVAFSEGGLPPQVGATHKLVGFGAPLNDLYDLDRSPVLTLRMEGEEPENHPPTCFVSLEEAREDFLETAPGVFVVTEGETITVPFTGVDPDVEILDVTSIGKPATASLSPVSGVSPLTSTFQWTPTVADKGTPYTVLVSFTDAAGESASCQVGISDINLRPVCSASDQTLECTSSAGASVTLDGSATDADDTELLYHWDVSDTSVILDDENIATPTGTFPVGVTMATLTVADERGGVSTCDVLITVQDTVPPDVMCTSDVAALWPPRHDMRSVTLIVTATDACADPGAVLPITVIVSSNEPDNGHGDGNTTGDVNGSDGYTAGVDVTSLFTYDAGTQQWTGTIQLRAERQGGGDGRKYTVDVTALDAEANAATTSCCIVVPHDRRRRGCR